MNWIAENYLLVIAFVGSLLAAFKAGAKLTKTEKDDAVAEKLDAAFDKVEAVVKPPQK